MTLRQRFREARRWFDRLFARARGRLDRWLDPPYRTVVVNDILPKHLKRRRLYVVQDDGFEEQAAMVCP